MAQQSVQEIAVELIDRSRTNPESRGSGLDELRQSIQAAGKILVPLHVFKSGKRYELDDGEGRWTIAQELGWKTVPCLVIGRPGSTALHQLIKGITGRRLTPWETAQLVGACLKDKLKQAQIAEALGKSEGWVSKFVTIWKASKVAQRMGDHPAAIVGSAMVGFPGFTDADKLYQACRDILEPPTPPSSAGPADQTDAGDTGRQVDLVDEEERKVLEEIQAAIAERDKLPFDQVSVSIDGAGRLQVAFTLSSLKAAQKAFCLPWRE
jgi:ParB/RepB/Spo0J family partition protein